MDDFWIFGYGSLMWHPGFPYSSAQLSRLFGYHRSLCIYSHHYRGIPEQPGLVLGLASGGSCLGMAFHVARQDARQTYDYLVEREQVNNVYLEKQATLHLKNGQKVKGLVFVADPAHPQYAGILTSTDISRIIAAAHGKTGRNDEYVRKTVNHLRKLGVYDSKLEKIIRILKNNKVIHDNSIMDDRL